MHRARFIILLVTAASGLPGQSPSWGGTGPFSLQPGLEAEITAAGVSLLAAGRYYVSETRAPDPLTLSRGDVPGFDRIALDLHSGRAGNLSDRTVRACAFLALFAAGSPLLVREEGVLSGTVVNLAMYAETMLLEQGLTALAKGTVRRSRPYAYDASLPLDFRRERNAALSFWSGHTASAFAGAVFAGYVFQVRNPRSRYIAPIWIAGMSAATVTAVMRVRAGQHFPSDVAAGAVVGSFAGWVVPRLHRGREHRVRVGSTVNGQPGLRILVSF